MDDGFGCFISPCEWRTQGVISLVEDSHRFIPAGAGEHRHNRILYETITGLSPLARGTPCDSILHSLSFRFIPAGAGNTRTHQLLRSRSPVYPRWRGEHDSTTGIITGENGLSPLARGTLFLLLADTPPTRFIPAGAGNTKLATLHSTPDPVYPRWRGEHPPQITASTDDRDLSPLARGTPDAQR